MRLLRRIADRLRHEQEDAELWDDWPICPGCWVRFPAEALLTAHYDREPECALAAKEDT